MKSKVILTVLTVAFFAATVVLAFTVKKLRAENAQLQADNVQLRREPVLLRTADGGTEAPPTAGFGKAFAKVSSEGVPGRYRWFEDGKEIGQIILHSDRSFTNLRGQNKPGYRWELQDGFLLLVYLNNHVLFSEFYGVGKYGARKDDKRIRIEKMP